MKECPRCSLCRDDADETCASEGTRLIPSILGSRLIDGKYRLDRRLGEGGIGLIYQARHLALQSDFAVTLLRPREANDPMFVDRFRLKAEALGQLKYSNVVDVTDFGVDPRQEGVPYLVMELLEGSSLAHRLRRNGPLDIPEALPIFNDVSADMLGQAKRTAAR